tara:strand:- start:3331 stop:4320 length:990 start_codon:yes stop_codon:yes gene_type:complete
LTASSFDVLIIGCGQIGSRHLQGLSKVKNFINITVLDPNIESLEIARKRFNEMPINNKIHSINFISNFNKIKSFYDVGIIATNAEKRREAIDRLFSIAKIQNLILEKVVFQSRVDFEDVLKVIKHKNIKAWVNCPRRTYPFFKFLKKETCSAKKIVIKISGNNWGMACNTIHYLDLFSFLTNELSFQINVDNLDSTVQKSKRRGFFEIKGKILVTSKFGNHEMELVDNDKNDNIFKQSIKLDNKEYLIDSVNRIINYKVSSEQDYKSMLFESPMQSELTGKIVDSILNKKEPGLTTLEESYYLHKPMLESFNFYFSKIFKKNISYCPIT